MVSSDFGSQHHSLQRRVHLNRRHLDCVLKLRMKFGSDAAIDCFLENRGKHRLLSTRPNKAPKTDG